MRWRQWCDGDSDDGAAGKPGTKPLTRTQVKSIVPDAAAMPGWRATAAAVAGPVAEGRRSGAIRCDRPTGGFCGDATSYARADFAGEQRPQISFSVLACKDTDTARAAIRGSRVSTRTPSSRPATSTSA
ncbi:hypothetical protein [Streptomyces sp. KL116D]|uniref:hypothetical protein n=1 Tax=Streptomyces sp. KL116D TaxID=3045152 RepID=UPI0035583266